MRVYLSGPMRGIPEFNFPAFDKAAEDLRKRGHAVFSPADNDRFLTSTGVEITARACFEADTRWICQYAEGIALLPGWQKSRGAMAEAALGRALDLEVWELGDDSGG